MKTKTSLLAVGLAVSLGLGDLIAQTDKQTDAASIKRGKAVYVSQCYGCHGDSDLTNLRPQSDSELFWKITEGRNQMPSFATTLIERQRWDVVNCLRTLGK